MLPSQCGVAYLSGVGSGFGCGQFALAIARRDLVVDRTWRVYSDSATMRGAILRLGRRLGAEVRRVGIHGIEFDAREDALRPTAKQRPRGNLGKPALDLHVTPAGSILGGQSGLPRWPPGRSLIPGHVYPLDGEEIQRWRRKRNSALGEVQGVSCFSDKNRPVASFGVPRRAGTRLLTTPGVMTTRRVSLSGKG